MSRLRSLLVLGDFLPDRTPRRPELPRSCAAHRNLDKVARPLVGASNLGDEAHRLAARRTYAELAQLAAAAPCCLVIGIARAAALRIANPADPTLHYYPHPQE